MKGWPSLERMVFVWEVGPRAALHTQELPRDLRWFRGLFR